MAMPPATMRAGYIAGRPPAAGTIQSSRMQSRASAIEEKEEVNFVQQLNSLTKMKNAAAPAAAGLARGGKYDAYLQQGKSKELLNLFYTLFANTPPPPHADMYGQNYATQVFSPGAIAEHAQLAAALWDPSPAGNIIRIIVAPNTRLIMIGDTHGQLEDVLWIFYKYGEPSPTNRYLFNGDFVDRSCHGLEILLLLLAFRRDQPDSLYMTRGNHEDPVINQSTNQHSFIGFDRECITKSGGDVRLHQLFCSVVFPTMPIMAHVTSSSKPTEPGFVVVHGGLPPNWPLTLAQIGQINRRQQQITGHSPDNDGKILFNLTWSDPRESAGPGSSGRAGPFTPADANAFCSLNNVRRIIRSHECKMEGFEDSPGFGGKVSTLFSASQYCGHTQNKGAILVADSDYVFKLSQFWAPDMKNLAAFYNHTSGSVGKLGANLELQALQVASFEKQVAHLDSPNPPVGGASPGVPVGSREVLQQVAPDRNDRETKDIEEQMAFVQHMVDQIITFKPALFTEFSKVDPDTNGLISKAQWAQVMLMVMSEDTVKHEELQEELFKHWCLTEPVNYTRFLGRFQIACSFNRSEKKTSTHEEMDAARAHLAQIDFNKLCKTLDPNGDSSVTCQEFVNMLPIFGVKVEIYEAATMYEAFLRLMNVQVLSLDDALICLSCTGQDIPPEKPAIVSRTRELLRAKGCNLARAFKLWDTTRDGFLQVQEIGVGLQTLLEGAALADASKVKDLDAAAPQIQLLRYSGQGYDRKYLEQVYEMSPDQANQILVTEQEHYEGYMVTDHLPNCVQFVKKGAPMQPQLGCSVIKVQVVESKQSTPRAATDTKALIDEFLVYLQKTCADVNKVNIIEWIRASVPHAFLIKNQEIMMKDTLKRVWWGKPAFQALCQRRDPNATGKLSRQDFMTCIQELNQLPEFKGHSAMSDNHARAICSVAAGTSDVVDYRSFVEGLIAVDNAPLAAK